MNPIILTSMNETDEYMKKVSGYKNLLVDLGTTIRYLAFILASTFQVASLHPDSSREF